MDVNQNENSLSFYLKELNHIYDCTLKGKLENNNIFSEKQEDGHSYESNDTFSQHKEKAFDYLIKAKSLNNIINTTWQNDYLIQARVVDEIISKFEIVRQNRLNNLIELHKKYEIDLNLVKEKKYHIEMKNLLDNQASLFLENILNRFIKSENNTFLKKEDFILNSNCNFLIYGTKGSGKMTWIIQFLIRNGIITLLENENLSVIKNTKIFLIDFKKIFENKNLYSSINLIEDLFKSISLLENSTILILLKNIETLFDSSIGQKETKIKDRFICDLIQELVVLNPQTFNRLFIVLSENPWLLHPSFLFNFHHKIHFSLLTNSQAETLAKELLSKSIEKNWLTNELVMEKSNTLSNFFNQTLNGKMFTGKLIVSMSDYLIKKLRVYLKCEIQIRISKQGIKWNNEYTKILEKIANEDLAISKKNVEIEKKWKHVKFKIGAIQKFKEKTKAESNISTLEVLNLAKKYISSNKSHEIDGLLNKLLSDFFNSNLKNFEELQINSKRNREFSEKYSLKSNPIYSEFFHEYKSELSLLKK